LAFTLCYYEKGKANKFKDTDDTSLYFSHLKSMMGRGEVFCALTPFSI